MAPRDRAPAVGVRGRRRAAAPLYEPVKSRGDPGVAAEHLRGRPPCASDSCAAERLLQKQQRRAAAPAARSFPRWYAETIKSLDALLERGGAVALFGETYPEVPANAWHKEFQALIDKYSTEDPARPQIREALKNEAVLLDSAFRHLERISVLEQRAPPVERFVDRALSFAATWHGRPGSREEDLAVEVRRAIAKHADADGIVREVLEGHALVARRPPRGGVRLTRRRSRPAALRRASWLVAPSAGP